MDAQGRTVYQCPINHPALAVLDANGDLAIACVTAKAVRVKGYGELTQVLIRATEEASGTGYREPPTSRLLGNAFYGGAACDAMARKSDGSIKSPLWMCQRGASCACGCSPGARPRPTGRSKNAR